MLPTSKILPASLKDETVLASSGFPIHGERDVIFEGKKNVGFSDEGKTDGGFFQEDQCQRAGGWALDLNLSGIGAFNIP